MTIYVSTLSFSRWKSTIFFTKCGPTFLYLKKLSLSFCWVKDSLRSSSALIRRKNIVFCQQLVENPFFVHSYERAQLNNAEDNFKADIRFGWWSMVRNRDTHFSHTCLIHKRSFKIDTFELGVIPVVIILQS